MHYLAVFLTLSSYCAEVWVPAVEGFPTFCLQEWLELGEARLSGFFLFFFSYFFFFFNQPCFQSGLNAISYL